MIVRYSKDSLKFLSKLDKKSVERIKEAVRNLAKSPPEGDIKPLKGYGDNRKRLRVGPWRVIYRHRMENCVELLLIIDIGNRGDIYK